MREPCKSRRTQAEPCPNVRNSITIVLNNAVAQGQNPDSTSLHTVPLPSMHKTPSRAQVQTLPPQEWQVPNSLYGVTNENAALIIDRYCWPSLDQPRPAPSQSRHHETPGPATTGPRLA